MRGQLFSTDFLVSVLVITVALGLFVHATGFAVRAFPGHSPDAALLSSALLDGARMQAMDPARITQSGCGGQAGGQAWCYALDETDPSIASRFYDSPDDPSGSLSVVLEGGVPLGPSHAAPADIRSLGAGRFTDWFDPASGRHYLLFSSSDGLPPDSNGRAYSLAYIRRPPGLERGRDFCVQQSVGTPARTIQDNCASLAACPAVAAVERLVACGSARCTFSVRVCQGDSG